jgi:hypothetical protein
MFTKTLAAAALTAAVPALVFSNPGTSEAAPPCSQWGFDGPSFFRQSNDWTFNFDSTGPKAQGPAQADHFGHDVMNGTISGGIDGYAVNLDVHWDTGSVGKYTGSVDANGFASGTTYDAKYPNSTATWNSNSAFRCITPPPS